MTYSLPSPSSLQIPSFSPALNLSSKASLVMASFKDLLGRSERGNGIFYTGYRQHELLQSLLVPQS